MTNSKRELAPGERAVLGILGIAQATLAFLAYWDLSHRPAEQVRGPKLLWAPVLLINWVGPLAYFFAHRAR